MRTQRRWAAAVCVAFALGAGQPACAAEPEYRGKPASEWVDRLTSRDDAEREAAVNAIAADPAGAKPVLDEIVVHLGDPGIRRRLARRKALAALGRLAFASLQDGLLNPNASVRSASFNELLIFRVSPSDPICYLGDLARISGRTEAIRALVERLRDESPDVRRIAARELGHVRSTDAAAVVVPALRSVAINDPESKVRSMAILSLGLRLNWPTVRRPPEVTREIQLLRLLGDLHDHDETTVDQALIDSGRVRPTNPEPASAIANLLTSSSFSTRLLATTASIGFPLGVEPLPTNIGGIAHGEIPRPEVIECLVGLGVTAIPALLKAHHRETDDFLRRGLTEAIDKVTIGTDSMDEVRGLASDPRQYVRTWATQKLIELNDASPAAAAIWTRRLGDPDWTTRESAIVKLMDMGQVAVPALVEVTRDKNPLARRKAVFVITVIGQPSNDAIDALVRTLDDDDEQVRFWACVALGRVKNQQSRLVPLMTARQTDASERVRTAARNAFQQLVLVETGK